MSKPDISNTFELEQKVYKFIRYGMSKNSIINKMSSMTTPEDFKVNIEVCVSNICDDSPDYDLIQFFMNSIVVIDRETKDSLLYLYNLKNHDLRSIERQALTNIIDNKLSWDNRRYSCEFVYNPYSPFKVRKSGSFWEFNLYKPPRWQEKYFYSKGKVGVPKLDFIPEIYKKYLMHLVDQDEDSYEYMLDWTANALKHRNYCILTTIGNQGVGKGVYGEILSRLVGYDNFQMTDNRVVSKDFNAQILNKRIVYLDEMKIKNIEQESKLKAMVNDNIEIEKKGIDAKLHENFGSFYFSSNHFDSVKITDDDRRFSLINLTETKLIEVLHKDEIASLLDQDNIDNLARFLWHREVDSNKMLTKFVCSYLDTLKENSRSKWQDFIIDDYAVDNKGKTIPVKEVSMAINLGANDTNSYGRKSFQRLKAQYGHVLDVKLTKHKGSPDKREWCVIFKEDW